jgi:monovalent cation/hydrogen antiporter
MEELLQLQTVILLLAAVITLVTIARRVLIPYPIFLVLGGLGLSLVPNVPVVRLDPDVVFLIFLPPVLWSAAYFTSLRDFRANLRAIGLLAIGLVLVTTVAVALAARALVPGLPWPAAVALGAIVSPPDAVAAAAIARRLGIPHRVVTVLEGESLINDASALVLYRTAIAIAVSGGGFVVSETLIQFVLAAGGGVVVGLVVSALARTSLRVTDDSVAHTAITLLAPYAAWIIAERTHTSAVLACVAGGVYLRQGFSELVPPATRIQSKAVWDVLVFILNGVIFILIGLHLGAIREAGLPTSLRTLLWLGALISATAIVVRLIWVPLAIVVPRLVSPSLRRRDPIPSWRHILVVAWTGMRGIVSLAAALALPATTDSGAPFPFRSEIIVLTFAVILATLVLQGLTLTPLIRALRVGADQTLDLEEARAREEAAGAALARLDELDAASAPPREQIDRLRSMYTQRVRRASPIRLGEDDGSAAARAAFRRLRHETINAERRVLIALRDQGVISDDVLHRLEHELDVEAIRIGLGELRLDDGAAPRT